MSPSLPLINPNQFSSTHSEEPDLEELFFHYYRDTREEGSHAA
jgi:hypothetical protein